MAEQAAPLEPPEGISRAFFGWQTHKNASGCFARLFLHALFRIYNPYLSKPGADGSVPAERYEEWARAFLAAPDDPDNLLQLDLFREEEPIIAVWQPMAGKGYVQWSECDVESAAWRWTEWNHPFGPPNNKARQCHASGLFIRLAASGYDTDRLVALHLQGFGHSAEPRRGTASHEVLMPSMTRNCNPLHMGYQGLRQNQHRNSDFALLGRLHSMEPGAVRNITDLSTYAATMAMLCECHHPSPNKRLSLSRSFALSHKPLQRFPLLCLPFAFAAWSPAELLIGAIGDPAFVSQQAEGLQQAFSIGSTSAHSLLAQSLLAGRAEVLEKAKDLCRIVHCHPDDCLPPDGRPHHCRVWEEGSELPEVVTALWSANTRSAANKYSPLVKKFLEGMATPPPDRASGAAAKRKFPDTEAL
jgi:hypothetical protein